MSYRRRPVCLLLASAAMALSPSAAFSQMCTPGEPLPPCMQGDASAEPALNMGIGNPVHLATGNKHQKETDLPGQLLAPGLELVRYYNTLDPSSVSALGTGWRMGYDVRLQRTHKGFVMRQADGGSVALAAPGTPDSALQSTGDGWQWQSPSGRLLRFDSNGRLVHLTLESGAAIALDRHEGAGPMAGLLKEARHAGLSLRFHYVLRQSKALLSNIDTPHGRLHYTFEHLPAITEQGLAALSRLQSVQLPDGSQRRYLYEAAHQSGNRHLVTGMTQTFPDNKPRRVASWDYDTQGRAIGVAMGERNSAGSYSRIRYTRAATQASPGLTEVHSAEGATQLRFLLRQGKFLLSSVHGSGCAACPPVGTSAAYDAHGRLQAINGTQLVRDALGRIASIVAQTPGWPGLVLHYQPASGDASGWQSALTGQETLRHDIARRSLTRQFANGDSAALRYNAQGLPTSLTQTSRGKAVRTELQWNPEQQPVQITHPAEAEARRYDSHGRLSVRRTSRPLPGGATWDQEEHFQYDTQHRLVRHELPEGGVLHYQWGTNTQLLGIVWEDAHENRHTVIGSRIGHAGYHYGNGLQLQVGASARGLRTLRLNDATRQVWSLQQQLNPDGSIRRQRHWLSSAAAPDSKAAGRARLAADWRYRYDKQQRLIIAKNSLASTSHWYAWDNTGALTASLNHPPAEAAQPQMRPAVVRDPSGLPLTIDSHAVSYGPNRRLAQVQRGQQLVATYTYNAFGHRIRTQAAGTDTHFLYTGNRLSAEAIPPKAGGVPRIVRRYLYAGHVPVGLIDYTHAPPSSPQDSAHGTLYAVHADLTGTPHLITDATKNVRWRAEYTPLGQARTQYGDLAFPLRQPGHRADEATGWPCCASTIPDWVSIWSPIRLAPCQAARPWAMQRSSRSAMSILWACCCSPLTEHALTTVPAAISGY